MSHKSYPGPLWISAKEFTSDPTIELRCVNLCDRKWVPFGEMSGECPVEQTQYPRSVRLTLKCLFLNVIFLIKKILFLTINYLC